MQIGVSSAFLGALLLDLKILRCSSEWRYFRTFALYGTERFIFMFSKDLSLLRKYLSLCSLFHFHQPRQATWSGSSESLAVMQSVFFPRCFCCSRAGEASSALFGASLLELVLLRCSAEWPAGPLGPGPQNPTL